MSKVISIFGSSQPEEGSEEYRLAFNLGKELARAGYKICNGGYGGIMAASAKGAKEAGGSTIGVTSGFYKTPANAWVDKEIMLPTPMERLFMLVELGDAYVILRGGTGTLLELACVWEFMNKNVIAKKPAIVIGDFWSAVVETVSKQLAVEGESDGSHFIQRVNSPQECVRLLTGKLR
ncbi:MAG: LOG family protein [Ignavibacteriales bacterium]|nr:LOG family protein [Ignavibacteriales bacterium]